MKRIIISAALLIALLIAIPINSRAVQNVCDRTISLIDETIDAAESGNYSFAGQTLAQAKELWQAQKTHFGIIFQHSSFERIEIAFEEASVFLAFRDLHALLPRLCTMRLQITSLSDSEKFLIDNIL